MDMEKRKKSRSRTKKKKVPDIKDTSKVSYQYDYGYSHNPENRKVIDVQPGENQFGLGGKLDVTHKINVPFIDNDLQIREETLSDTYLPPPKRKRIDPINYLYVNSIKCQKFNYSVP